MNVVFNFSPCASLQPLPEPVAIGCDLPGKLVGDCLMLCEFVNMFGPLFDVECFFNETVTFGEDRRRSGIPSKNCICFDDSALMSCKLGSSMTYERSADYEIVTHRLTPLRI